MSFAPRALSSTDAHNIIDAIRHLLCDTPRLLRFLPPPPEDYSRLKRLAYYFRVLPAQADGGQWRRTERKMALLQVEQEVAYVDEQGIYLLAQVGVAHNAMFELLFVIAHFRACLGDDRANAWMLENTPSLHKLYAFIMRELAVKDAEKRAAEVAKASGVLC
jgi:hypothetical protein